MKTYHVEIHADFVGGKAYEVQAESVDEAVIKAQVLARSDPPHPFLTTLEVDGCYEVAQ